MNSKLQARLDKAMGGAYGCEVCVRTDQLSKVRGDVTDVEFVEMRLREGRSISASRVAIFVLTLLCGYPVRKFERKFEVEALPYGAKVFEVLGKELR